MNRAAGSEVAELSGTDVATVDDGGAGPADSGARHTVYWSAGSNLVDPVCDGQPAWAVMRGVRALLRSQMIPGVGG